jgi:ribosomal-protein-alanine N-acetyltransferase
MAEGAAGVQPAGSDEAKPHELAFRPMLATDLDTVVHIEQQCYSHPWTRGNFTDSLASGYSAWLLLAKVAQTSPVCLGYYVAMLGVEEMHLLNIAVEPRHQHHGHAQRLLKHLEALSQARGAATLWLEVRESNARARALYERWGFASLGRRKRYYPAAHGEREDALVMNKALLAQHAIDSGTAHGLD